MDPQTFDFEIGVPVDRPVAAAGRMRPSVWPAADVARTEYRGGYEGLGPAWAEFHAWTRDHGHACAEDLWEVYIEGPEGNPDPTTWRTALYRPLAHG
jgi:effector-binding domain-containing protein